MWCVDRSRAFNYILLDSLFFFCWTTARDAPLRPPTCTPRFGFLAFTVVHAIREPERDENHRMIHESTRERNRISYTSAGTLYVISRALCPVNPLYRVCGFRPPGRTGPARGDYVKSVFIHAARIGAGCTAARNAPKTRWPRMSCALTCDEEDASEASRARPRGAPPHVRPGRGAASFRSNTVLRGSGRARRLRHATIGASRSPCVAGLPFRAVAEQDQKQSSVDAATNRTSTTCARA